MNSNSEHKIFTVLGEKLKDLHFLERKTFISRMQDSCFQLTSKVSVTSHMFHYGGFKLKGQNYSSQCDNVLQRHKHATLEACNRELTPDQYTINTTTQPSHKCLSLQRNHNNVPNNQPSQHQIQTGN